VSDPHDRRPTRLQLTEQVSVFDSPHLRQAQAEFLHDTMSGLDDGQLEQLSDLTTAWLAALSPNGAAHVPAAVSRQSEPIVAAG
jgi:hypothetical protein